MKIGSKKVFGLILWAIGGLAILIILTGERLVDSIGSYNFQRLEKMDFDRCIDGGNNFSKIRTCLNSFGIEYTVLGDTTQGNFRVTFSKLFAEAQTDVLDWKFQGVGSGITRPFNRKPCFLLQNRVPILTEQEKKLLKTHINSWLEKNPEGFSRYVTKVVERDLTISIYSQPLLRLQEIQIQESIRRYAVGTATKILN